jgi:RCC1 and BTB domain-containing protein
MIDTDCGGYHSLALTIIGEVYAWGYNVNERVGNWCDSNQLLPIKLNGFNDEKIVIISCGWSHSLALTESNRVFCFVAVIQTENWVSKILMTQINHQL